ncbi:MULTISPECIES: ribonuclease P protein component [unclassified Polaribacter]|uniref:ribonuclease P protein component n=1 Tax=unclassified Polaribacter TaxID=196858 RepID=UPI0011BE6057|nr:MULTISPECIES: ribonuclease P protein component [unclassified Polaribacter]TXD54243.1 ribonuclease P protein component [Polaribacter sp. IC063]TXD57115.1 ribonuclease P protein component [Polaribacter sp. IC066]
MKCTLGKKERLKSKKLIERLYKEGTSLKAFPLRMMYLQTVHTSDFPAQVGVSVPKRNFKKAPDRNRLKRLMRESYRLQKGIVYDQLDTPHIFMISYLGKDEWSYKDLYVKMEKLLTLFVQETKNIKNDEI